MFEAPSREIWLSNVNFPSAYSNPEEIKLKTPNVSCGSTRRQLHSSPDMEDEAVDEETGLEAESEVER